MIDVFGLEKQQFEQFSGDIWQLLILCDREFVPPLSCRTSTTASTFKILGNDTHNTPIHYFNELKTQRTYLALYSLQQSTLSGILTYKPFFFDPLLEPYVPTHYITTVIVHPQFRNKGIAGKLYSALINELLNRREVQYVSIRTWSTNMGHMRLIKKIGFSEVKRIYNDRGIGIDTIYFVGDLKNMILT